MKGLQRGLGARQVAVPELLRSVASRYRHGLRAGAQGPAPPSWTGPAVARDSSTAVPAGAPASVGTRDERLCRLEAILFLAREPLSSRRLSQYANLADGTEARTLVRQLNEILDAEGRAFRVEEIAGGYQLLTRPKFASWLRRLAHVPKELRLSAPALETLAVIAYRQPAGRAEIEAVRGVNCGELVRQLMERDLVRIAGRSQELGRPYLYATTQRFLQLFGLRTIADLPRADQLRKGELSPNSHRQPTDTTETRVTADRTDRNEEDSDVTATIRAELSPEELLRPRRRGAPVVLPRASDEDFAEEDEEEEFDDLDDEEDEDDDFDDDEEEEEEEFEDEEDLDDEWEEVDDEEELDEEEDEDWDDDDDEDDGEEEEEEEEDWD